jgi:hypothetical protein
VNCSTFYDSPPWREVARGKEILYEIRRFAIDRPKTKRREICQEY